MISGPFSGFGLRQLPVQKRRRSSSEARSQDGRSGRMVFWFAMGGVPFARNPEGQLFILFLETFGVMRPPQQSLDFLMVPLTLADGFGPSGEVS